jgi:hypothetical protein
MAKDRLSPLKENILPTSELLPMGANRPANYLPNLSGSVTPVENDFMPPPAKGIQLPETATTEQLYEARRFPVFNPEKTESDFAYGQSLRDKAANGILKGVSLAATTVAGGFATLYGAVKSPFSGRLADIWDNEGLRSLDKYNNEVDNYILPNYYTDAEKNSAWYSTDNWMTANFLFDKLIKNSGFAVGAMVGGNIANAGLLRAGSALGKLAGAGALAAESSQAFKLFTPLLRNTARAFSAGKNIEAAAILEKEISSIADLSAKSSKLAELGKLQVNLANFNDTARRYAIAAYSSAGEASFEALQTSNEYRNQLIEKYKSENYGAEPPKEILNKINADSEKVGKTSFFGNLALLSLTEAVQLPYLLGSSYNSSRQTANSLVGKVDDVVLKGEKYVAAKVEPVTKFGKIYKKAKGVSKYVFDPKEAAQEVGQYALQVGTQNYFKKANESEDANILTDGFLYGLMGKDESGKEVGALISKEGIESGILGGITGGIMQAKGVYAETKAVRNNTKAFLEELNSTPSYKEAFENKLASGNRGVVLQQQYEAAIKQGDKLEAQDLRADMMHNYLASRIKYGRVDMVMDDIEEFKSSALTEAGLASLKEQGIANINDTPASFQKRIAALETTAKNTEQLYKALNLRYSGEILTNEEGNPILSSEGKQLRKYSDEVIDKLVYASSKIADYDVRIPQVNSGLSQTGISTMDVLQGIILDGKPNKIATEEALAQINKLDVTSDVKDELKTQLSDVIELSLRRKLFIEEYNDIKENPTKYKNIDLSKSIEVGTVTVKQKQTQEDGKSKVKEIELEIGKEYSLENSITREGNKLRLAPKVTILSKTLGGEYEVKLPDGSISFLTPEQFKDFKISNVDNTSDQLTAALEAAINKVLAKPEFAELIKTEKAPEESNLEFVNSLDNPVLTDAIEAEFNKSAKDIIEAKAKESAEVALMSDPKISNSLLATMDNSQPTLSTETPKRAEAKKSDRDVVSSTSPTTGKPHHDRANKFGFNLDNFSTKVRDGIRGVYVTLKNEADLGLSGLMINLKGDSDADVSQIIAFVMTDEKSRPIGEDGKALKNPTIDNTIYQVMPLGELEWDDKWSKTPGKKESMFREGTPQEVVTALTAQYKNWRKQTLGNPKLTPFKVRASFGNVEYVQTVDSEGKTARDTNAKVAVEDAGLITKALLGTQSVLIVPTVEDSISKGSTTYNNVKGLPFLNTSNGYTPLKNRKLTTKEVTTIYDAILSLAKDVANKNNASSAESKRLYNWLKSIVYWGTPSDVKGIRKNAASNSIWFEKVDGKLTLFISNNNESIPFTPASIEMNEAKIKDLVKGMYHNINATLVKGGEGISWSDSYEQITSAKDGKIESKTWKNYQTYLLSKEGRTSEELPLSTQIRPLKTENDVNRKGIYFTATELTETFIVPEVEVAPEEAPIPTVKKTLIPGGPKPVVTTEQVDKGTYKLDGSQNTYTSPTGKVINFAAVANDVIQKGLEGIKVAIGGDLKEVLDTMIANGATKEDAQKSIKGAIYKAIQPQLEEDEMSYEIPDDEDSFQISESDLGEGMTESAASLFKKQASKPSDRSALRVKLLEEIERFQGEDWNKVEAWLKTNFPNVPVYRVKNIINATNGRQAWGMLKDGAIYVYENAEVGTIYHEVLESVVKSFATPEELAAIRNEFKSREGSFVDRPTGETINYAEATNEQIKEQLAEEFRDYVLTNQAKEEKSLIARIFSDIVNFIKQFFIGKKGKDNTTKLFEKIGNGYYKNYGVHHASLSFAKKGLIDIEDAFASADSEFRLRDIKGENIADIVQHMTYLTLTDLVQNNKSLFSLASSKFNKQDLYTRLKEEVQTAIAQTAGEAQRLVDQGLITQKQAASKIADTISLWKSVTDQWDELVDKHQEHLKSYNIEFDENDDVLINDEDASKKADYQDANKIDSFKKANAAIKLLLSTIPITKTNDAGEVETIPSSINGVKLLPTSEVYMSIMNNVHSSRNVDEMMERLRELALKDTNYQALYRRLTKNDDLDSPAELTSTIKDIHDLQLLAAFWKTFKKQSPDVKNVYILENGDIAVGDSNFTTAAAQVRDQFNNSIIKLLKGANPYFVYSSAAKAYVGKRGSTPTIKPTIDTRIAFLKTLGIDFNREEVKLNLSSSEIAKFETAVDGIKKSINDAEKIATLNGKFLNINGRLRELAELKAKLDNPEFSSTYFNVNGERTQTFIGTNALSDLYDFLSQLDKLDPAELAGTQYEYLITDDFAKNSVILQKMFDENGDRIAGSEELFKPGYADGLIDTIKGKKKQSSRLTYKERLIQELNLNLKGFYLNLVPGDASMEWMINTGNTVSAKELLSGLGRVNEIFKGYFIDELNVSREERPIVKSIGRETTDLRFLKPILGEQLHNSVINSEGTVEEVYAEFEEKINTAIEKFINNQNKSFSKTLTSYQILNQTGETFQMENVATPKNMSQEELDRQLTFLNVNFMINNIEMHKLLYSDPYQYKDELKRTKNFNSPRQAIISNSIEMNAAMNKLWNEGYEEGDISYTDFNKDFFKTTTLKDVKGISAVAEYDEWEETDGGGVIGFKSYRNFRIRAGEWNDNEEGQYRFDVAYEKEDKRIPLSTEEQRLIDAGNPGVKSAYTPIKPIVSGNKTNGRKYNDVVLDKFALYPMSYRIAAEINKAGGKETSNAINLYNKMQAESIDYIVFETSRKVGAEEANDIYNPETGEFNNVPYEGIVNVPFSIMSVQSEVPSKDDPSVTMGSQVTKLITMDYLEAGVPVDYELKDDKGNIITEFNDRYKAWYSLSKEEKLNSDIYKEIQNNQDLLAGLIQQGYDSLLKRLNIKELADGKYEITNFSEAANAIRNEIFKNEVNDNVSDALQGFINGDVVIEATPAYKQVRNILYSIANKQVISKKINGGFKVQIPSTFLEQTKSKLTEINGKKGYTSDTLAFYEDKDGKRVCEIMVGRWFNSKMSDKDLLAYLNSTEEGQKVLSGLAFRIPTQKQNSIDVFVIKQFLPKEFGDSVVIPSALVKKVGSDFDIDKLSIYFKNVYTDGKGNLKAVPFFGIGEEAKNKAKDFLVKQDIDFMLFSEKDKDLLDVEDDYETAADKFYKQSLQNAYIESSEKLVSHPKNFERLIKPNSADQLKGLANNITKKLGMETIDYSSTKNLLNRTFMSGLRHSFVTGKYAIGIAAVNQTNHSLNQRSPIYIDLNKLNLQDESTRFWLGDGKIKFKNFNTIEVNDEMVATLSMIKNAAGQDISDIIGQFIDGYVDISKGPWIMELGATPNVASTWLFLAKIGVPIDTVSYFMNQPIVRDYLQKVENAGYSWLFIEDFVNEVKDSEKYRTATSQLNKVTSIPSNTALFKVIGEEVLSSQEKAEQQFILDEFLKYSQMASQMFTITQGSNFDTATFNDPYLVFKKFEQLKKAQNTIISSIDDEGKTVPAVDNLLQNSFLGKLSGTISDIRDAYSTILLSDNEYMRNIMEDVLRPYTNKPDREFVKLSQKAVADIFDWAVQNNEGFNKLIENILLNDTTNVAKEIDTFLQSVKKDVNHPLYNNQVVKNLQSTFNSEPNSISNITLVNKDNKTYDQNQIIYAFNEIKIYLNGIDNIELYERLVKASVLQSGLSNSPISFTSLLPYEDFKDVYNKTLSNLKSLNNFELRDYATVSAFERNNWSDDDIVPRRKATWGQDGFGFPLYNKNMKFNNKDLNKAMGENKVPPLLKLSSLARESSSDVIVYTWEDQTLTNKEKAEMRNIGDYSYIKKALFKKVYNGSEELAMTYSINGKPGRSFIYKAINAWGDSFRANEFYATAHKSIIDNGFIQVDEVTDDAVIPFFIKAERQVTPETPAVDIPTEDAEESGIEPQETQQIQAETTDWTKEENNCPNPF